MLRAISTHVFLRQRLHPGLLDTLARAGAEAIEVFAAKQHFDYTSRQHIKEIADWFQSSDVEAALAARAYLCRSGHGARRYARDQCRPQ